MKVLFLGATERGYFCLKAIKDKFDIVGVVMEHNHNMRFDMTYHLAITSQIPIYTPESFKKGQDGYKLLEKLKPDIAVLCVYEKIVPKDFIDFFKKRKGCINLHGGRLPGYRGSSVMRWQIRNCERQGAFTIVEVTEGIDDGNVYAEYLYDITENTTIADTIKLEHKIFPKMLLDVLNRKKNNNLEVYKILQFVPGYWHKIQEEDRKINFDETAEEIHALVRSETKPYPGAYCFINHKKIRVWKSSLIENIVYSGTPGRIAGTTKDGGVIVVTGYGGIVLEKISCEDNKTIFNAKSILKVRMQLC